jgi:2-methylcitrate dehydratase PrpD
VDVTRDLAAFVVSTDGAAIGAEAREQAKRAFLDTLGVALAGSGEDTARIVAEMVRHDGGRDESTVLGAGFRAPATTAALANGTAAHALDFDDVAINMRGHPSVPLFPALLALGEKLGSSGGEVLDAFAIGFEVECKLGRAIGGPHYMLGWHATSTLGTIGAAAGCARLLRLDEDRCRTALSIGASLASGLQQNFGTMTKPLHAGWAAHNGITAATLAERGFTANDRAIEGESGFLRAMTGGEEIDPTAAVRGLGDLWEIVSPGISVKLYPCCYATHRAIDAALEVRRPLTDPADISGIEVIVSPGTLVPLISRLPRTGLEGKFSLEYCLAAAFVDGRVNLASFADDQVARTEIMRLIERMRVREEGSAGQFPIGGLAEVAVWDSSGAERRSRVEAARGDPTNPLSWDELAGKFRDCAELALGPSRVERVVSLIERLDQVGDVRELTAAASG